MSNLTPIESMVALTDKLAAIANVLRQPSPTEYREQLRHALYLAMSWQEVGTMVDRVHSDLCVLEKAAEKNRHESNFQSRESGYDPNNISMRDWKFRLADSEDIELFRWTVKRFHALVDHAYELYNQSQLEIPEYRPKICPYGGRQAHSLLKVWESGKTTENLPHTNSVFGWSLCRYSRGDSEFKRACVRIFRMLRQNRTIKKGKAPSAKAGRRLIKYNPYRPRIDRKDRVIGYWLSDDKIGACCWALRCYSRQGGKEASRIMFCREHGYRNGRRIIEKLIGVSMQNNVFTCITGPPERMHGQDYRVPCRFSQTVDGKPAMVHGWVLVRRGWSDCFHTTEDMSPRQVSLQLDHSTASSWHYTDYQDVRKKRAEMLRTLRSVDRLTDEDSIRAGNCLAGTEQFKRKLGIVGTEIAGRTMAAIWRANKYYDLSRFAGVVTVAKNRQEESLAATTTN